MISKELLLLKGLLYNNIYNIYYKYINELALEKELIHIYNSIKEYYKRFPDTQEILIDNLRILFYEIYPHVKNKDLYEGIFVTLSELPNENPLTEELFSAILLKHTAADIAQVCLTNMETPSKDFISDIQDKLNALQQHEQITDTMEFESSCLSELLQEEASGEGLNWRLKCLREATGPLNGGSLGHIFARVDTGKTSLAASEFTHLATQLAEDEVAVWVNNEEKGSKVRLRLYSAMLNKTKEDLLSHPAEYQTKWENMGGNKILLYDNATTSLNDIKIICNTHNVRLLLIDQGDKIKIPGKYDKDTNRLTDLYGNFRELAKSYPKLDIITLGQASAEAANSKIVRLDWMNNSKTGKPGELDYAIGIGKVGSADELLRYIHLCKNKMNKGQHALYQVVFNPLTARYQDI